MILCDAGVLLCLVDRRQPKHQRYIDLTATLPKPFVTTWSCLTEAMYLSLKRGGWSMQQKLASLILNQLLIIYHIEIENYPRLFELMAIYQDKPMDLADASLVLAAEKLQERRILTIDSDFYTYRINGKDSFDIIQS